MSRKKLTLSVEERLTRRAKSIAKKRGTSVSRLVETFFTTLEEGGDLSDAEQLGTDDAYGKWQEDRPEEAGEASSGDYKPSEWARRWRGAFAEEGTIYPDDPSWEEEMLSEEIERKHAS